MYMLAVVFHALLLGSYGFGLELSRTLIDEQVDEAEHAVYQRGAVPYRHLLWPAQTDENLRVIKVVIPYTVKTGSSWFYGGLGKKDERIIRQAASVFEKYTCIRFVKRTAQRDYVEFYMDKSGFCESDIGRIRRKQTISLGQGCRNRGHVTHELMHTLGFYHEHTRPDRDKYVRILWDNIKPGNRPQFEIQRKSTSLGQSYDFRSIMHYKRKEFSKNGKDTIQAIQNPSMPLGSMNSLSALDIMKINRLYKCPQAQYQVVNYHVTIVTGRAMLAGTNAGVFVELYGSGVNSGEVELNSSDKSFEYGRVDKFNVVAPDLGTLRQITIRQNGQGYLSSWYLVKVIVEDDKRKRTYTFPCSCWLSSPTGTKKLRPAPI